MMPLIASALLSVAGQLAFKWISSAFSGDKSTPPAGTPRAGAPKDEFAAVLQQSERSPEPAKAPGGSPLLLASAASVLPVAPAASALPLQPSPSGGSAAPGAPAADAARAGLLGPRPDLQSAADAYQRVQDWQSP
jgi:hypothetical protein